MFYSLLGINTGISTLSMNGNMQIAVTRVGDYVQPSKLLPAEVFTYFNPGEHKKKRNAVDSHYAVVFFKVTPPQEKRNQKGRDSS